MPPCGRLSFRGPVGGAVQTKARPRALPAPEEIRGPLPGNRAAALDAAHSTRPLSTRPARSPRLVSSLTVPATAGVFPRQSIELRSAAYFY